MKRLRFGPQNSALISMLTSLCWWSWGSRCKFVRVYDVSYERAEEKSYASCTRSVDLCIEISLRKIHSTNSIQLSPQGEVNSDSISRDSKRRGIYLALFTDPEGKSCFSIYQSSWIKMKKSNFFKIKIVTY